VVGRLGGWVVGWLVGSHLRLFYGLFSNPARPRENQNQVLVANECVQVCPS